KKLEEKQIEEEQAANAQYWKIPACCDDDDDYNSAITPVLSTEEPGNSLTMGDEHLDTISATKSDEETENSLSMGDEHLDTIPATESDEVIKSSVKDLVPIPSESKGITDTMCDVHFVNNPTPLKAKDHVEIVVNSKDGISSGDDDSLYNENIEYVEASPHDSELVSLEEAEIISSGSTTTHSDISLLDYEAFSFNNDHIEEISGGSTTTHSDISLLDYEAFSFNNDHIEEISGGKYDCFYFWNLPDPGELISILNSEIRENLSTTSMNLPVEDDYSPLLTYVVWIFLAYLTYPVIPPYLHSCGNEDTIFDPGITIDHVYSFKPGLSHRCGAFKKFNTHRCHLNEWPMIINGKNIIILDVALLLHLAGSQPMLKSSYKAEDGVIISIPPLVGGVADVVVEIKGTGERKTRKGQNRIKTEQKREAWRSPEKSKPITVKKERKMKKIQVQGTERYKS
nr:hypothetical protein [Tanacetum cinerariifolium]